MSGAAWPELQALPASTEATLRSRLAEQSTQVEFVNARAEPVIVYWLNYDGKRVQYQRLDPGAGYVQQTFVTHPWVVCTLDQVALVVFQPTVAPGRATIR
jgi:hypothetical protein